jgi:TRAP-type C4-dicarboxylate transport system permease small subunit
LKKIISNIDIVISCAALVIVILSVIYGVIMRYVFSSPPAWTNELAGITFTWVVFFGSSAAFKRKMHIGIELLVESAPPSIKRGLIVISELIIFTFLSFMVIYGFIYAIAAYQQPTSVLRIPNTYIYIAIPLSFTLMLFHQISYLVSALLQKPCHKKQETFAKEKK